MSNRRVIVTKNGGALGDRFDKMKKKTPGQETNARRKKGATQTKGKRASKVDTKRAPKKRAEKV